MNAERETYARKAISQIPRMLGNLDRNPYSPTYGCFHRDYWLDKTSDFPDAVRQFSVQTLALVYKHDFPGNIYKGQKDILEWATAGLDFWARIQHNDGSFDEFYPNERGWIGPTGFTTYTSAEAYILLQDELPQDVSDRVRTALSKAAHFIAKGQSEEDHLANHYAMACLAVWKVYEVLQDTALEKGFDAMWREFLGYHNSDEGWCREYDGVDPGYLSATVSFLSKIYKNRPDPEMREVLERCVNFCGYFVYPDGFYAGSLGSRNTAHFYSHGFEILGGEMPMAAAIAEKMLQSLSNGKLVPPEIMSDRYMVYRVSEYLESYLDYSERPPDLPPLPYERPPFTEYYPQGRIYCQATEKRFIIANLAKGGVVKIFDRADGSLLLDDSGIIGRLTDGRVVTSQWIDPNHECEVDEEGWRVIGSMQVVPAGKPFTPLTQLMFRSVLVSMGWVPKFSHFLKATIRKRLMLGNRPAPIKFERRMRVESGIITLVNKVRTEKRKLEFEKLSSGGGFMVRYVPQSRYFQAQEFVENHHTVGEDALRQLKTNGQIEIRREVQIDH